MMPLPGKMLGNPWPWILALLTLEDGLSASMMQPRRPEMDSLDCARTVDGGNISVTATNAHVQSF